MALDRKYTQRIRILLMTQRTPDDIVTTLDALDHKLKKNADKMNWAIRTIYNELKDRGCLMFHIILSMQDHYAPDWLVENVLDEENKAIVTEEMAREYHRTHPRDRVPEVEPDVDESGVDESEGGGSDAS
jgi:hypothetical protein